MRYLFVHQNFPAQFLHLVRRLVAENRHDVVFISEANANQIRGVRKVVYQMPRGLNPDAHRDAQEFELAMLRAEAVARTAANLKALGYEPDVIIGHHGWGELLNIADVWPDVPLLGYQEFYYRVSGTDVGFDPEFPTPVPALSRVRAKNAVNLLTLTNPGHGQSPTLFQRSTYPDWAQGNITVLPEGVNLDICRPDPGAGSRPFELGGFGVPPGAALLSYVSRDLEPYRGFHVVMRALPRLLRERPDLHVVMVGGDGVSYGARLAEGTWKERLLGEVGPLDAQRVLFPGRLDYDSYLRLLQRSDCHVYFTYPFVASWSLREALACGCAIVASDTAPVLEFVADRETGLLSPFLDPGALADRVLELLEDRALAAGLRAAARVHAEATLSMPDYLDAYEALITRVVAG